MTGLSVPDVAGMDMLTAAFAYAKAGWYLVPVRAGTKHPGSVVGDDWQRHSSRDPQVLTAWLAGTGHGIALHAGRSGAIVFDVDNAACLARCPALAEAIAAHIRAGHPVQSTGPGRGHYVFAQPPGRILGNSKGGLTGGWGEVRGRNGVIVVAPTVHPEGRKYEWLVTGPVPELPAGLAVLLPDAGETADAATDAEVAAFLAAHTAHWQPHRLELTVADMEKRINAGEARHETALVKTVLALKEAAAGYFPAADAITRIGKVFTGAACRDMTASRPGTITRTRAEARSEYAGIVAWAVGQTASPAPPPAPGNRPPAQIAAFIARLREWLDLPDPAHVLLTLAAAATRNLDGEPVWLLLVAVPSSGKTESVKLLDDTADGHLNEVTAAGLLGWSKGKEAKPAGVLARLGSGSNGLVTFGDLSSLLATSNTGGRDAAFGLLRRAYDGHVTRDISPPARLATGATSQLSWTGRLTVVAAVTGAIDRYSVHADQLGPRWVYSRIAERDTEGKRRAARRARNSDLAGHRATARKEAHRLVLDAASRISKDVPDSVFEAIEEAALVTGWGRGAVPRHGYGRREIDGVPIVEDIPRIVRQLHALARGLLALGLPAFHTAGLARRVALDSMPEDRRGVLEALSTGEILSTAALARRAGLDRKVTRMRAEELEVIGVVEGRRDGEDHDDEYDRRPVTWRLAGDDGEVLASVFKQHRAWADGWDEIWVTHTPSPPEMGKDQDQTASPHPGNPNFVPPFRQPGGAP